MTMDRMVEYLENRGFEVEKRYDRSMQGYSFRINKSDLYVRRVFTYPATSDPAVRDRIQIDFLEDILEDFREAERNYEESKKENPRIKDVIFNDPATIVLWDDGTKTVVKATDEKYDPEKGMAMAIARKALGNKHDYYNVFAKWLKKRERGNKNAKA